MSISEISAASVLPVRSSARISVMAWRARGPGAVRGVARRTSLGPLTTGASGATAWLAAPSPRPSSSSQCSRPAWTRVKGRRSSTTIDTRLGSSRTTSARRISGSSSSRARTCSGLTRQRLAPWTMPETSRMRWGGTREAPRTSTAVTAKRGEVSAQCATSSSVAASPATAPAPPTSHNHRRGRAGRRRRTRPTRCPATATELRPTSASAGGRPRGEIRPLFTEDPDLALERDVEVRLHALARDLHQRQHVGGHGPAAVDDEVGVLGRDLRPVDALALEPGLLDELGGDLAGRVLPDEAGRGQGQRLAGLLALQPLLHVALDAGQRPASQLPPADQPHRAARAVEC